MILWVGLCCSCDARSDERAEARTLLSHLNALQDARSLTGRSAALVSLQRLPLNTQELSATRDACHAAHGGLLEAEAAQTAARRALAHQDAQPGGTLSKRSAEAIAADIDRSNRALEQAKSRFPACQRTMQKLLTLAH